MINKTCYVVMIGTPGNGFPEHGLIPPLKFIDFGYVREGFKGVESNVLKISRVLATIPCLFQYSIKQAKISADYAQPHCSPKRNIWI